MELRFILPQLRRLDLAGTEVLLACVEQAEAPPHGVAGLVDWRLGGRLSSLIQNGSLTGQLGEVLLLPGKPRLPFDKVVLFGVGRIEEFGEHVFRDVVERMLKTLEGLRARSAVVELPGRKSGSLAPERAADILLETAGGRSEHDMWTLVETIESQRAITHHMVQERRRQRQ